MNARFILQSIRAKAAAGIPEPHGIKVNAAETLINVDLATFTSRAPGALVDALDAQGNRSKAFVPARLPTAGDLLARKDLRLLVSEADRELARLDGVARQLDPGALFRNFLRREAVLSSAIEGTHTSLADLALFEATRAERTRDEQVVENYVTAHNYGWDRVVEIGVGRQLFVELHEILMRDTIRSSMPPCFTSAPTSNATETNTSRSNREMHNGERSV